MISAGSLVPTGHPLRAIKALCDARLVELSPRLEAMYAREGRPSIAPERLLKAKVLAALYGVKSERRLCEDIQFNFLYRWFLDLDMGAAPWDASTFSKNQERLLAHAIAEEFFFAVVTHARIEGLMSVDHFSVDGTLIEAWASIKSFKAKETATAPSGDNPPQDPGNPEVNFRGEKRRNDTHASTTDPEAELARKGKGKEAKLSFGAHAVMENRNGLLVDLTISPAASSTESREALGQLQRLEEERGIKPRTVAGDKGYHNAAFVAECRENGITPHIATIDGRQVKGLDRRTTTRPGYAASQRCRKKIEEIFGWMKTCGGFRKSRYQGIERTQLCAWFTGIAYNVLRISRLMAMRSKKSAAPA